MANVWHDITGLPDLKGEDGHHHRLPERAPRNGITVVVAGAGIAGMAAALELWRKGMDVQILERTQKFSIAGDQIQVGISGTKILFSWPDLADELRKQVKLRHFKRFKKHNGSDIIPPSPMTDTVGIVDDDLPGATNFFRPHFAKILFDQVRRAGIEVKFDKKIVNYYEDSARGKAGVVTSDGSKYESDLVLAAEGAASKSQQAFPDLAHPELNSGRVAYRGVVPLDIAGSDPGVKEVFGPEEGQDTMQIFWVGAGKHGISTTTKDAVMVAINDKAIGDEVEDWHNVIPASRLLERLDLDPDWCPAFRRLIEIIPHGNLIAWPLIIRETGDKWVTDGGRVLQLGDSAHTLVPSSSNGATQALEDASSIATCLEIAKTPENIPVATKVHNLLRADRVSCAQRLGFWNQTTFQNPDWNEIRDNPKAKAPNAAPVWIRTHDPAKYALENYEKAAETVKHGTRFQNTNIPPGYPCKKWSIAELIRGMGQGKGVELVGDWS